MQKTRSQGRDTRSYRIGEGEGEAKSRKKPHKRLRRDVENMRGSGGKGEKYSQERVGSVAADADNIENIKEAGR